MNNTAMIVIDICILTFSSIGLITSTGILFLVFYHRRQFPMNTSILLSCNTYPAIILGSLTIIDMYAHNLYGDIYKNISFDNWWCYIRPYFILVAFCSIYHSYLLQACFRLFRVVFRKYKQLQDVYFMFRLVLIQWLIVCLLMMPGLILHHFEYLPEYYHCQIPFTNFQGLILVSLPIYHLPMMAIGSIYFYIIYYTRWKNRTLIQQHRQRSNRRDTIVLRRIIILVEMLLILTFPFVILWLVYIVTGYLHPLSYHLQWLTCAVSLLILPIASVHLTPHLRDILRNIR